MEKKLYDLTIDPELEHVAPPLAESELEILKADILEHGCKFPLIVWGETIVDGHNRYRICRENEIPFGIEQMDFTDKTDAKKWIIKNQLGRRNLTDFQRCEMVLPLEEELREDARKRQSSLTRDEGMKIFSGATRDYLAELAGVSFPVLKWVKTLIEDADEEMLHKLRRGEMRIHTAYRQVTKKKMPAPSVEEPAPQAGDQPETQIAETVEEEPSGFDEIKEQLDYAFETFMNDLNYALDWLSGETATPENEKKIMNMIDTLMKEAKAAVTKKMEEEKK